MVVQEAKEKDKKGKMPNWFVNLSSYFTEYCDATSIHGFKFLGEKGRYLIEKIWWLIFIVTSFYFCIFLIVKTYQKWLAAPVLVSFATSETPIWKIPFPAITVCPLIKSMTSQFNFSDILKLKDSNSQYSEEEKMKFDYMSLVCPSKLQTHGDDNATDIVEDNVINFLMEVAPDFVNTIHMCQWMGNNCTHKVNKFFAPILTSEGVCFTLNMLDRDEMFTSEADLDYYDNFSLRHQPKSEWSLEGGYSPEAEFKTYPRRTVLSGPSGGLDLVFYTNAEDIDYTCGDSLQGYIVLMHHPSQMPRSKQRFFWVPLDQMVSASVTPKMMTTSEELKGYAPKDRKCYLQNEKSLKFFKVYNQQNCLLECLANHTYKKCECVAFYMPRYRSTPICGPAKLSCISEVNIDFLTREAIFQIKKSKSDKIPKRKSKANCDCLPSCFSLDYAIETSQMDWKWRQGNIGNEYNNQTTHLSRLKVFFRELQFMTSERSELYGLTEFWANCGGLLGLFTGFSFISVVEIVYFATIRIASNIRKYGRRHWSGAAELLDEN